MKNKFSLVIDSTFRTKDLYPKPTRFVVPVNDIVTNEYINTPIDIFSWGHENNEITGTILGGNQQNIILSSDFSSTETNHYKGCLLVLYNSTNTIIESSKILTYDPLTNSINIEIPFSNSIHTNDTIGIQYPNSITNPYIIQILGYNAKDIFEYSNLYMYNWTKNWIRPIKVISEFGLANLTSPIPTDNYSPNDVFEIRTSFHIMQYPLQNNHIYNSIMKYNINPKEYIYKIGTFVYIKSDDEIDGIRQLFYVKDKTDTNELILEIIEYGGPFTNYNSYLLYDLNDTEVPESLLSTLQIVQTLNVIDVRTNSIPNPDQNVIYFGSSNVLDTFKVYNYIVDKHYIILLDSSMIIDDNGIYGFLQQKSIQCSLNVSTTFFKDNMVCMNIKLDTLILPNREVKDYKKLLSYFPYVIVRLYNIDASYYSKNGTIISNNRCSTNSQFICPIGNLQNPDIIRFVEVSCQAEQIMKMTLDQNLYFEILLPDGTLLEFAEESLSDQFLPYVFNIRNTVAGLFSIEII